MMNKYKNTKEVLVIFIPSLLVLALVAFCTVVINIPIDLMMRDLAAIAGISPLSGILSSLGSFYWAASATVCIFSAVTLYQFKSKKIFDFLLFSGILSSYLAFDDFFMFHEYIGPRFFYMKETFIIIMIMIAVIIYLLKFGKLILTTDYKFFVLAIVFLSLSVALDVAEGRWINLGNWGSFYEDGFKWLGITSWLSYFSYTSYHLFLNSLREKI